MIFSNNQVILISFNSPVLVLNIWKSKYCKSSILFFAGLQAIHNVGVIYRDMKLKNVLLSNCGNLMIADFGLSKWLSRRQRTGTICGTLAFMAPEVASGSLYEHSVDLWSLGILLYCLAFARYPFPRQIYGVMEYLKMCFQTYLMQGWQKFARN